MRLHRAFLNIEAVGGGWGLVDFLVKAAERAGIEIRYRTGLRKLLQAQSGEVTGVLAFGPEGYQEVTARAVVLACWVFAPQEGGKTHVTRCIQLDPKGSVPGFLINAQQAKAAVAVNTLKTFASK